MLALRIGITGARSLDAAQLEQIPSLLPDFLAVELSSLLAAIDDSITVAASARSMEAAAVLRGLMTSPCPVLSAGCADEFEQSEQFSRMWRRIWWSAYPEPQPTGAWR